MKSTCTSITPSSFRPRPNDDFVSVVEVVVVVVVIVDGGMTNSALTETMICVDPDGKKTLAEP
jgi:hypothetical protein